MSVVSFPGSKHVKIEVGSNTGVTASLTAMRTFHVDSIVEDATVFLFDRLDAAGFGVVPFSIDNIKDAALMIESLKSLLLKQLGEQHPLQMVAAEAFEADANGDIYYRAAKIV